MTKKKNEKNFNLKISNSLYFSYFLQINDGMNKKLRFFYKFIKDKINKK